MARPQKKGLEYFPLDIDMDQEDKVALIEAEHGIQGFGILIKLLMKIYSVGYCYPWTEKEQKLFLKRVNVDINTLIEVVNAALKWDFFNKAIYDEYQILTSHGIQKRYLQASERRKAVELITEYLPHETLEYIEKNKFKVNLVNANINRVNVDNNPHSDNVNTAESTQSKVKESKVKESKEEESKCNENSSSASSQNSYNLFEKEFGRLLSPMEIEEINDLENTYGFDFVKEALKRAVVQGVKNLKYTHRILETWRNANLKTIQEVLDYEKVVEDHKSKRKTNNTQTVHIMPPDPAKAIEYDIKQREEKITAAITFIEFQLGANPPPEKAKEIAKGYGEDVVSEIIERLYRKGDKT